MIHVADRRGFGRALTAAALVSLAVLIVVAALSGVSDTVTSPGIPSTNPVVSAALPLVQWLRDLGALLAVGFALVGGLLAPHVVRAQLRSAVIWSVVFLLAVVVFAWMTLTDIFALAPADALNATAVRVFLTDTIPGRVAVYQVVAAGVAIAVLTLARTRRASAVAFALLLTAASAPAFNGHAGLGGGHESATASLALHIAALSVWVGGLVATGVLVSSRSPDLVPVVRRFSTIALWCVIVAAESGLINASMRLTTWQSLFTTTYGLLITLKSILLIVLVLLGWRIRRQVLPNLTVDNRRPFLIVAAVDIVIMGIALALAVVLARTDPNATVDTADLPLGYIWIAVILTSAGAYLWAMWRARSTAPWSLWRAGAFALGLAAVAAGTAEFSGEYSQVGFTVHVLQTTLLTFAAPLLLVLGLPRVVATPVGRALRTYPEAIAIGLVFTFYTVIFGPLYDLLMVTHEGHLVMQLALLAAGFCFVIAVIWRSAIAIVIPMAVWPAILVFYPTPQALANVLVTEAILVVLLIMTLRSGHREVAHERERVSA